MIYIVKSVFTICKKITYLEFISTSRSGWRIVLILASSSQSYLFEHSTFHKGSSKRRWDLFTRGICFSLQKDVLRRHHSFLLGSPKRRWDLLV